MKIMIVEITQETYNYKDRVYLNDKANNLTMNLTYVLKTNKY